MLASYEHWLRANFLFAATDDLRAIVGIGLCAAMFACATPAEHSNPLDPESPNFTKQGVLRGQVTTIYQPYQALAGANVHLQPLGISLQSDSEGRFVFGKLDSGSYVVVAAKPGYTTLQRNAKVIAREDRALEMRLDGLPVVASAKITSARVVTREASAPRLFLEIAAEVTDPDGANDIQRVLIKMPGRAAPDSLTRASGLASWQRIFSSDSLAPLNLHNLVGASLEITAEDGAGEKAASQAFQLARLITEEPQPVYPINGEVFPRSNNERNLRWQLPAIAFDHSVRVEVYRLDAGFPVLILTANLRVGAVSLPYPGSLTSGTYYWTVKVLDGFGNSSRSKEATFQVQ